MPRTVALLIPLPLALSCTAVPTEEAAETGAPLADTGFEAPSAGLLSRLAVDRRQFELEGPGLLSAHIPGELHAELSVDGLLVWQGDDELGLRTSAYGLAPLGTVEPVLGACAPTSERVGDHCAPAAELPHGALTEWRTSAPDGVHQGWTLYEAPAQGEALVELRLAVLHGELVGVDADGQGATLTGSTGRLWRYEGLVAWDAAGKTLSAGLFADGEALVVAVDVAGASWPVTVDPTLGSLDEDKLIASDGASDEHFGVSVAGAGDVDGDGYDDLVIGAYRHDDSGSAYVYYGSSTGISISSEDKLIASDGSSDDRFGASVAGAGDVDGDGYDDLVIGAYEDDDNGLASGSAYVYYGDCASPTTWYPDSDGDGDGDSASSTSSCVALSGYVSDDSDCDDGDAAIHPGARERVGDGVDSSCDGAETCYADADDDGYTDGSSTVASADEDCSDPGEGTSSDPTGECNDSDAAIHPGATEICDAEDTDEDCDGLADDADDSVDSAGLGTWYADSDGDGYGDAEAVVEGCDEPSGVVDDDSDCDDTDPDAFPGAEEVADDGIDQDCDGSDLEADDDGEVVGDGDKGSGCATVGSGGSNTPLGLLATLGLVGLYRRRR